MAITDSERVIRDTLRRLRLESEVLFFQRYVTPRYFKEPVDFVVIDSSGRTHLIEVKETGGNSIARSQFKDYQYDLLSDERLNHNDPITTSTIIARFHSQDRTKNHSHYYDLYFAVPGDFVEPGASGSITVSRCRDTDDAVFLGGYEHGGYVGAMEEDAGVSPDDNPKPGFTRRPFPAFTSFG